MEGRPTVTLPRRALLLGGAALLLLIALLVAQLALQANQRQIVSHQLEVARLQAAQSLPLMRTARDALPPAASLRRAGAQAARLADDVHAADLPATLRSLRALAAPLDPDVLASLATGGDRLVAQALGRDLVGATVEQLRRIPQLVALQRRSVDIQRRGYRTQRDSLAIQRRSLAVEEQSLQLLRESLAVARETLVHASSIDRKTGAPVLGGG